MKLSETVKPVSYLKAKTAEAIREVSEGKTLVITLHGEAKAILQDVTTYEQTQESLALLKMLAQSQKSLDAGKKKTVKKAFANLRKRVAERDE